MLGMMLSRARKMTVTGWTKGAGNPDQTKPIQPLQKMNPSIKKKILKPSGGLLTRKKLMTDVTVIYN